MIGEIRRIWRYRRGNHNPYVEEEQTTQWQKEKVQNDKVQNNDLQSIHIKQKIE
jgi:hypothetical protein